VDAKPHLSVIIITLNEADNIRDCLQSVSWADEIIVVDAGSEDETVSICRQFTDKVFIHKEWRGFGPQKNLALEHASGEWVLSIDADERISGELKTEIENALSSPSADAYSIPRQSYYLGRRMRHGGWWPDYVVRLFRRPHGRFSDDVIHERVLFDGNARQLKNPLEHYSFRTLEQVLDKINRYSSEGAWQARKKGRPGGLARAVLKGFWAFFRCYILRAGFLDGQEGFIAAVSNAEGTYYRYLKLRYS
jgi:glycosyltransferase involved in cell wall biosynthesis